jgi:tetratricopeptide (TPR) repeat protein
MGVQASRDDLTILLGRWRAGTPGDRERLFEAVQGELRRTAASTGKCELSIDEADKAIALDPDHAVAYTARTLSDHRNIVLADPMDALARLQLGRALSASGDAVEAKNVYNDLFALWKNADQDIPVLTQARAEHAKLQ